MWHKMDRTFRVPKTAIRLQLTSPNIYQSPRSITLGRIFQSVLSDDLNSHVYDAMVRRTVDVTALPNHCSFLLQCPN